MYSIAAIVGVVVLFLVLSIRVLNEYERAVVFRLGRVLHSKGPGLIILIPVIDRMLRVSMRVLTLDVPSQDVITRDNVSIQVSAVVYFKVVEPTKSIIEVEDFLFATSQLAQTTLRSVCGGAELDGLLAHREKMNMQIQDLLDKQTTHWGIKVNAVELKHIDLPQEMQRAMAKQAEAERERRAKVINAEGEFQAATKLSEAAEIIARHPQALQLRYLQTMQEMSSNAGATLIPIPLDIMTRLMPQKGVEPTDDE